MAHMHEVSITTKWTVLNLVQNIKHTKQVQNTIYMYIEVQYFSRQTREHNLTVSLGEVIMKSLVHKSKQILQDSKVSINT